MRLRACVTSIGTVAAIVAAILLIPAASDAAVYKWKSIGSGDWNVPGNWERVSGEPCAAQFPNCVGDEAVFPSTLGFPTFIDIPADMRITVGAITVYTNNVVTIREKTNNSGRLVFTTSTGGPALLRNFSSSGSVILNVRMELRNNLTIMAAVNTEVRLAAVAEVNQCVITKSGAGKLVFREQVDHSGGTRIEDGVLELTSNQGAKAGALEIGDGVGEAESASVVAAVNTNQLDASNVVVNSDGVLRVGQSSKIGNLTVNDGFVAVEAQKQLYLSGQLTMTGGLVFVYAGGQVTFERDVTATASQTGPARFVVADNTATFNLFAPGATRMFTVNDGPGDVDLQIGPHLTGARSGLLKDGAGVLRFVGSASNTYEGVTQVRRGRLELARVADAIAVPGRLEIGTGATVHIISNLIRQNIADTAAVSIATGGLLTVSADETIGSLALDPGGRVVIEPHSDQRAANLRTRSLTMTGGRITVDGTLHLAQKLVATSTPAEAAVIDGSASGTVHLSSDLDIDVADGPQALDLRIDPKIISAANAGLTKRGAGALQLGGANSYKGATTILDGTMIVTRQINLSLITATGGTLGGNGSIGRLTATGSTIAPGGSPGRLTTGDVTLGTATTLSMELNGTTPGTGYDQLDVNGAVNLGGAKLSIVSRFTPAPRASFTLVLNDGTDPVAGTFAGLAEGATAKVSGRDFTISYRGGDGNDVVLADTTSPLSYYLAEGATGDFFDDDVLIANPNMAEAPVTLTFLQEGGGTVVERRTIAAQSRITVHVDQIAGLENTSASVQVTSDKNLPLVVERTMFWDASYYGGHTANAVAQPETRWIFAEGFQGFFDTYILIANANAEETTATVTFLREGDTPVVSDGSGRRVRAQDDLRQGLSRGGGPRVRDHRRGHAAGDRRAGDVFRDASRSALGRRSCQHRHRRAVHVVVPRRGRDRRLLQHVHPVEQSAGHGGARSSCASCSRPARSSRGRRRSRRNSGSP